MESVHINLVRGGGTMLRNHMGLEMLSGAAYRFGGEYRYVEIPLLEAFNPSNEEIVSVAKGQNRLKLLPACTVSPKKYAVEVDVNPALYEYADITAPRYIEMGTGDQPVIWASFRKGLDLSELEYLVRLYLVR